MAEVNKNVEELERFIKNTKLNELRVNASNIKIKEVPKSFKDLRKPGISSCYDAVLYFLTAEENTMPGDNKDMFKLFGAVNEKGDNFTEWTYKADIGRTFFGSENGQKCLSQDDIKRALTEFRKYEEEKLKNRDKNIEDATIEDFLNGFFNAEEFFRKAFKIKTSYKSENRIFYGVPGSGKSFAINKRIYGTLFSFKKVKELEQELKSILQNKEFTINKDADTSEREGNVITERIVFHPDYTYSDFVGQILPTVKTIREKNQDEENNHVVYEFKPGPFTRILKEAKKNSGKNYFLIIEEINRGNAAAIFGDLFQLLDRNDNGESEYEIDNLDIAKIVYEGKYEYVDGKYKYEYKKGKEKTVDEVIFATEHLIHIPKNLCIYATMNTSDQNVFTLDTAFQRRWDMELVKNDFNNPNLDFTIEGTGITWKKFAEEANKTMVEENSDITGEDKQLGAWFIRPDKPEEKKVEERTEISREKFANKVLKYLWDDAFEHKREKIFNNKDEKYNTLEKIITQFDDKKDINVFNKVFYSALIDNPPNKPEEGTKSEVTTPNTTGSDNTNKVSESNE